MQAAKVWWLTVPHLIGGDTQYKDLLGRYDALQTTSANRSDLVADCPRNLLGSRDYNASTDHALATLDDEPTFPFWMLFWVRVDGTGNYGLGGFFDTSKAFDYFTIDVTNGQAVRAISRSSTAGGLIQRHLPTANLQ